MFPFFLFLVDLLPIFKEIDKFFKNPLPNLPIVFLSCKCRLLV